MKTKGLAANGVYNRGRVRKGREEKYGGEDDNNSENDVNVGRRGREEELKGVKPKLR